MLMLLGVGLVCGNNWLALVCDLKTMCYLILCVSFFMIVLSRNNKCSVNMSSFLFILIFLATPGTVQGLAPTLHLVIIAWEMPGIGPGLSMHKTTTLPIVLSGC